MLGLKNPIDGLLSASDRVAQRIPADRLFTWLAHTFETPRGWAAWVKRTERDPTMVFAGQTCPSEGVQEALFVRELPTECQIEDTSLQSKDGHAFNGLLRVPVRVITENAELSAFAKTVLGSKPFLAKNDLAQYLQPSCREVLAELAARHDAEELLKPIDTAALAHIVQQRLGAVCLAGGLSIDGPVAVSFSSAGYSDHRRRQMNLARQQQEADARAQIQQALASAQRERLDHLVTMLEQMRATSHQHGDRSLMELLQAFSPAERGQMYGAMWQLRRPARATHFVAAVSGMELLLFEPASFARPAHRHRLPDSLGALRSVSSDEASASVNHLLVGANQGIWVIHLATGQVVRSLRAQSASGGAPRGGFNAAAMLGGRVLGSHSELGLLSWPGTNENDPPIHLLPELTQAARTIRCLQVRGERAWVAIDERVVSLANVAGADSTVQVYAGSRSAVSALAITDGSVYAGNQEGQVLRWSIDDPQDMAIIRKSTGQPVESVDVVDAGGVEWLLVAGQEDALLGCVLGDAHTCRYQAGSARVRRAAAANDCFVAMNDNRDRLFIWSPDQPAAPRNTVVVPYITSSSVQDICLVSSS